MLPLLYVVRMDVEPDYLPEFVKWYDTRHGPDLIGTGFHSCNAYHARSGGPFICNVYEVPSLGIFSSAAYAAVRENDTQLTQEVLRKISNHSNTVYEQREVAGIPVSALGEGPGPSRAGAVCAPVVSTLRLDVQESRLDAFLRWFREVEAPALLGARGALRARLARQCGKHPLFPSKQPEWLMLVEWACLGDALADGSPEDCVARITAAHPDALDRLDYGVSGLSATLLNCDNWVA